MVHSGLYIAGSAKARVARMSVVAVLLLAILSEAAPYNSLSPASTCTMTCCASRAPHVAGSCAEGLCHIALPVTPIKEHAQQNHDAMQTHDALQPVVASQHHEEAHSGAQFSSHSHWHAALLSAQRQGPSLVARVFSKPCDPSCGTGTSSSTIQHRPRDATALSHAGMPRPPSNAQFLRTRSNSAKTLSELCRQSRPRPPPLFLS